MSRPTNSNNPFALHVTVTVAGTPVQPTATAVPDGEIACFRAHPDNTGMIYLGDSSADALSSSSAHVPLAANQAEALQVKDISKVWCNSSVSGEKVIITFARN
ncbi:MAG: hypothetical protein M0R37_14100 [Bacteroidales bacterium]|jgi:hypothetical protein|nr:hypothetical protein [Bacteroidales bacterium]